MNDIPHHVQNLTASRDGVLAVLRTARALAAAGRAVDLTGLDNMIGLFCAQVLDLPDDEARCFRPSLSGIATELEQLGEVLTAGT